MKYRVLKGIAVIVNTMVLALAPVASSLAVPARVSHQGYLADSSGNPFAGPVAMRFEIFDAETGGASQWSEDHPAVALEGGVYTVVLGSVTSLMPSVFLSDDRWLEVTVNGEVLEPRQRFVSVPYAMQSAWVATGGVTNLSIAPGAVTSVSIATGAVGSDQIADGTVESGDVAFAYAGSATKGGAASDLACTGCVSAAEVAVAIPDGHSLDAADGSPADALIVDASGRVGIGTAAPARNLEIKSAGAAWIGLDRFTDQLGGNVYLENGSSQWIFPFFRGWQSDNLIVRDEANLRDVMTFEFATGKVGIGTSAPAERLDVSGNAVVSGSLVVGGSISGQIDVTQITGVLGSGYTLTFPDVLNNLATVEIESIAVIEDVVVVTGPGYDVERVLGFGPLGQPEDSPGFSMEHPFVFEAQAADAPAISAYFDQYFGNPSGTPLRSISLIVDRLNGTEAMRWNFYGFAPQSYTPAADGRTRFTLVNSQPPDHVISVDAVPADPYGSAIAVDPAADRRVEIASLGVFYPTVEDDPATRTLTFTFDLEEGAGLYPWLESIVAGSAVKHDLLVIEESGGTPVSQFNYYGCFPTGFEMFEGFNLDTKAKTRVKLSYDVSEPVP